MTCHSDVFFPDKDNESKKNQVWAQIRAQNLKKPAQTAQNWPFFSNLGPKNAFFRYIEIDFHCFH